MIYRKSIQIMRGIAVVAVLGYHFGIPGFKNGFLGVDVFFVISGYLMAHIYKGKSVSEFYLRRARRLIPAYVATIGITAFIAYFRLIPSDFAQLGEQIKSAFTLSPNIYFWSQNSYFQSTDFNPLLNLWSLGVEFHFYLLVPLVFRLNKLSSKLIPLLFISSLIVCLLTISISPKTAFFLIPFRIWEFLFGYLVARMRFKKMQSSKILIINALSLLLLGWVFIFMPVDGFSQSPLYGHPGIGSVLTVMITGILIGLNLDSLTSWGPLDRTFEWLGKYSYSLYLIHFPILVLLNYKVFSGTNLKVHSHLLLVVIIALIFSLAILQFHYVEKAFRDPLAFRIFLIYFLVLSIPTVVIAHETQQTRFTQTQRNISNAYSDRPSYRCGKTFRLFHPFANLCIIFNSRTQNNVLLLGNSHADALKDSFVEAAKRGNISVYFWASNDPLSIKTPELLYMAQNIYRHGIGDVYFHFSPGGVDLGKLSLLIDALAKLHIRSHILGPIPVWNESVPKMLWSYHESGKKLPIQSYKNYLESNSVEIEYLSTRFNGKSDYFDLAKSLCTPKCKISDLSLKPFYFDGGHLTKTGARKLLPVLIHAIAASLSVK